MMDADEKRRHGKRRRWSASYVQYWIDVPYCEVCRRPAEPPHHVRTRGAGGGDEPENLLGLCVLHHRQIHDHGADTFAARYPRVAAKIKWRAA